jgi:NAD(P)-dependent dehydrogenase (short-subunit alcohol dehydrogenase family)
MNLFNLHQEVAVVIGATGVLGGSIAEGLAKAGATVAVAGRNEEKGTHRVESIMQKGGKARFFYLDATEPLSVASAHRTICREYGTPSILINGAGGNNLGSSVTPDQPFERISLAAWKENFNLNLIGGILLPCQVFGPSMIENRKGSIINIASVAAHIPASRVPAYSAAKSAVLNLTQFLAREWASHGIRVNSITPGFFPAEQNRKLLFNEDGTPTPRANSIMNHTPMRRFGLPEELIGAVLFLASSEASSFVTGSDIRVDGGFLAQTI